MVYRIVFLLVYGSIALITITLAALFSPILILFGAGRSILSQRYNY